MTIAALIATRLRETPELTDAGARRTLRLMVGIADRTVEIVLLRRRRVVAL